MELSISGIPFALDVPVATDWIKKYIPFLDVNVILAEPHSPPVGQATLNFPLRWQHRPSLQLNRLWWPTHACRWSEFHGIMAEDQYQQLLDAAWDGMGNPVLLPLTITQGDISIAPSMYVLPPRPLQAIEGKPGLYLVSCVDPRFYWQWANTGNGLDFTSWSSLISDLAVILGITLGISTIEDVYALPHPESDLANTYENAAICLDAALANVGRILVANLDGTWSALEPGESQDIIDVNLADNPPVLAGGDFSDTTTIGSLYPAEIQVSFPLYGPGYWNADTGHVPTPKTHGDLHVESVNVGDALPGYDGVTGTALALHTTAEAYSEDDGSTIDNASDVTALATQLATDWYNWQDDGLDIVYANIQDWQPEGYHDLIWCYQHDACYTRVQRRPYNWLAVEFQHHFEGDDDPTTPCPTEPQWVMSGGSTFFYGSWLLNAGTIVAFDTTTQTVSTLADVYMYETSNGILPISVPELGKCIGYHTDGTPIYAVRDCCATQGGGGNAQVDSWMIGVRFGGGIPCCDGISPPTMTLGIGTSSGEPCEDLNGFLLTMTWVGGVWAGLTNPDGIWQGSGTLCGSPLYATVVPCQEGGPGVSAGLYFSATSFDLTNPDVVTYSVAESDCSPEWLFGYDLTWPPCGDCTFNVTVSPLVGLACSDCSGLAPAIVTITSSGWTAAACSDPSTLNGTFSLLQNPSNPCQWNTTTLICSGTETFTWTVAHISGYWVVTGQASSGPVVWNVANTDCSLPVTVTQASSGFSEFNPPTTLTLSS